MLSPPKHRQLWVGLCASSPSSSGLCFSFFPPFAGRVFFLLLLLPLFPFRPSHLLGGFLSAPAARGMHESGSSHSCYAEQKAPRAGSPSPLRVSGEGAVVTEGPGLSSSFPLFLLRFLTPSFPIPKALPWAGLGMKL